MNYKKLEDTIVKWLDDYIENSGQSGFVLGVSGGVDSAVASTLCAKTKWPIFCVEMPIDQHSSHVTRSEEHISWLKSNFDNVISRKFDLSQSFHNFVDLMPEFRVLPVAQNLANANTRSRLRMVTLYYLSNAKKLLVVGTGNKIEDFGVGYFTRGGDGVCDLSPIADLTKTEVWGLARHLGVNEDIINASPSDGLYAEELTDEDALGATYKELEWAMETTENDRPDLILDNRQTEILEIYRTLNQKNKFKMLPIPICDVSNLRK